MQRTLWDLTILVLGLNVWATFNLIPTLHQPKASSTVTLLLVSLPPLVLAAGTLLRSRWALLGVYPLALLAPTIVDTRLVGVNVYSAWSFVLVAVSFLAYTLASAALLRGLSERSSPAETRRIRLPAATAKLRRRRRMYAAMAVIAAVYPTVLLAALYLDPEVRQALGRFYPQRAAAAGVLFGIIAMGLWFLIFYRYFYLPLRAHIRGDRTTKADMLVLRHQVRHPGPRIHFYLWVALALSLMAALFLTR